MQTNLIVVDDFYGRPDVVRDYALSQEFSIEGNYPGRRTKSLATDEVKSYLQSFIEPHGGKITTWGEGYNGAYQYTVATERSWIHTDDNNKWSAMVYLTPNAPLSGGTGFFRHEPTGRTTVPSDPELEKKIMADGQDITRWSLTGAVGNVYNRLIIFRADQYHMSMDYFGKNLYDGRLFQTFFFDTEY